MRCPNTNIDIIGHTDGDGDPGFNQILSEKRAAAVQNYLVRSGLPAERFTTQGYGSSQPIARLAIFSGGDISECRFRYLHRARLQTIALCVYFNRDRN